MPSAPEELRRALLAEAAADDESRRDVEEEAALELALGRREEDLLHAEDVELDLDALFGRGREKLRGRLQHRAFGAAHERLVSDDMSFTESEDRLEHGAQRLALEHAA